MLFSATLLAATIGWQASLATYTPTPQDLVGSWVSAGTLVWTGFAIRNKTLSLGPAPCSNLPYKILEQRGDSFYIEVFAPKGKCRNAISDEVLLQLTINVPNKTMEFRDCPTRHELEMLKTLPEKTKCSFISLTKKER